MISIAINGIKIAINIIQIAINVNGNWDALSGNLGPVNGNLGAMKNSNFLQFLANYFFKNTKYRKVLFLCIKCLLGYFHKSRLFCQVSEYLTREVCYTPSEKDSYHNFVSECRKILYKRATAYWLS